MPTHTSSSSVGSLLLPSSSSKMGGSSNVGNIDSLSDSGAPGYTWHLSLRVDRPVEGCTIRPHAYMYSKKLDDRDVDKPLAPHSKRCRDPPPHHEFVYRWFRGPRMEPCAFGGCPRRTSFSPHDWSRHALGGVGSCGLQCVSTQSNLYRATFCNSTCFRGAWKTQCTVSPGSPPPPQDRGSSTGSTATTTNPYASSSAPTSNQKQGGQGQQSHFRSSSSGIADDASVGSVGSAHTAPGGQSASLPPALKYVPGGGGGGSANTGEDAPGTPGGGHSHHIQSYSSYDPDGTGGGSGGSTQALVPSNEGPGWFGSGDQNSAYSNSNTEWVEISRDQYYVPHDLDVGRKLQLEATAISVLDGEILMQRVVKTDLVLARAPDPVKRNLVTAKSNGSSGSGGSGGGGPGGARFRVVTYNVLAEIYATQQQYPYCDFWALSWEYRFQNILRELIDVGPDVICMQEVQADHYTEHLYNALSDQGFDGVYKQKTRASMGLAGKVDGCALFWRRTKFHLVETYSIEFNELAQRQCSQVLGMNPRSEEGVSYLNRLSRDNVAQLAVLELVNPTLPTRSNREPINQICVANTHLYSHKDYPDVKLWQTWQLLQELENFVLSRAGTTLPLMICGDFNSTPDTAVYDLLSRQAVHPAHPDVNLQSMTNEDGTPSSNPPTNVLPDVMAMTHSFQLGSVYQTVIGEEPRFTNYTVNFKGVLDYMWYSAQFLRPLSAAPIPDEEELCRHGEALPSTQYSSDHVMLISDMQILYGPRQA